MCNCFGQRQKSPNRVVLEAKNRTSPTPAPSTPPQTEPQSIAAVATATKPIAHSTITTPKPSSPSAIKTCDLTEIFTIPHGVNQSVQDVAAWQGFELGDEIGKGSYAKVYRAKRLKDDKMMACKVMECTSDNLNLAAKNELFIMERTNHPHIIKMYRHFMVDMDRKRFAFIFMQLCDQSLSVYMRKKERQGEGLPEATCKRMAAQMITALNHMHQIGIAHRDFKMGNVLLDKVLNCLVADFGLSRVVFRPSKGGTMMSSKYAGTPNYMAPEIYLAHEYSNVKYNPFCADVWALGCVLWCVVNQGYLFSEKKGNVLQQQMAHKIRFSKKVAFKPDKDIYDIFYRMLDPNVEERISMSQLMLHPWVAKEVRQIEEASISCKTTPSSSMSNSTKEPSYSK